MKKQSSTCIIEYFLHFTILFFNMEQMKSKSQQVYLSQIRSSFSKIQSFIKKRYLRTVIKQLQDFPIRLYKYSGRQSQQKTQWFLKADLITPDMVKNVTNQDKEAIANTSGNIQTRMIFFSKSLKHRRPVNYGSASFSHTRRSVPRNSSEVTVFDTRQALKPLENSQINSDDEISESSEVINNFRQQKTRRQQYKNKLLLAQRTEMFKFIDSSLARYILNPAMLSKKKEKIQHIDHFINMDVTVHEPENNPPQKLKKKPKKFVKSLHSKTERNGKNHPVPICISGKYQQLKQDEKIYLLRVPNQMNLSPGVTFRQNQKHAHSFDMQVAGATRKKLQFLKNEEMNPVKIKMAQLMSFKKIATSNNMAYCSSMKTLKELPKDGTQTKISIDSKQFLDEPSGSKKLIKIANRKIYEQLLVDFNGETTLIGLKKGKIKLKKDVKVRFDNVTAS